jgi:hypothetical protein
MSREGCRMSFPRSPAIEPPIEAFPSAGERRDRTDVCFPSAGDKRQVVGDRLQGTAGEPRVLVATAVSRCGYMPKMKVHPGMLLKKKEGRFQVPGVRGREAGCRGQVTGNSGRTLRTGGDRR